MPSLSCTFQLLMDRHQTLYTSPFCKAKADTVCAASSVCRSCNMHRWGLWRWSSIPCAIACVGVKNHHAVIPRQRNRAAACCFSALFFFFVLWYVTLAHGSTSNYHWFPGGWGSTGSKTIPELAQPNVASFRPSSVKVSLLTAVTAEQVGQSNGYRDVFGAILPLGTAGFPLVSTTPPV